jgi:site-specific DNA-methyltransferase (adenine-specific)
MAKLRSESVDAVVADPPYGIAYKSKKLPAILNDERPYVWWLAEAYRVTKMGGAILCFCRWDVQEDFRWALELAGYTVRSQVIWDREHHGAGDTSCTFAPQHDVMWFATKGRFRFLDGRPRSVQREAKVGGAALVHPNQKPIALMSRLITYICPRGGVVLDPMMGSGSTGVAAVQAGRRFVGIEINPGLFRLARKRIRAASKTGC